MFVCYVALQQHEQNTCLEDFVTVSIMFSPVMIQFLWEVFILHRDNQYYSRPFYTHVIWRTFKVILCILSLFTLWCGWFDSFSVSHLVPYEGAEHNEYSDVADNDDDGEQPWTMTKTTDYLSCPLQETFPYNLILYICLRLSHHITSSFFLAPHHHIKLHDGNLSTSIP